MNRWLRPLFIFFKDIFLFFSSLKFFIQNIFSILFQKTDIFFPDLFTYIYIYFRRYENMYNYNLNLLKEWNNIETLLLDCLNVSKDENFLYQTELIIKEGKKISLDYFNLPNSMNQYLLTQQINTSLKHVKKIE